MITSSSHPDSCRSDRRLSIAHYCQEEQFLSGIFRDAVADTDASVPIIYREREDMRRQAARIYARQIQDAVRQYVLLPDQHMDRRLLVAAVNGALAPAPHSLLVALCRHALRIRVCRQHGRAVMVEMANRLALLATVAAFYLRCFDRFCKGFPVRAA